MKRLDILAIILLTIPQFASAQFRAGLSNRIMLKTDGMFWLSTKAINAEVEVRVNNRFSLSFGYWANNRSYNQYFWRDDWKKTTGVEFLSLNDYMAIPTKGTIDAKLVTIQGRRYFNRFSGPFHGVYLSVLAGAGLANVQADAPYNTIQDKSGFSEFTIDNVRLLRCRFLNYPIIRSQIGAGYECVLTGPLFLDLGLTFDFNKVLPSNSDEKMAFSGVISDFGSTLFTPSKRAIDGKEVIASSKGMSLLVKLGWRL